jgi:hypothetical protein
MSGEKEGKPSGQYNLALVDISYYALDSVWAL